MRGFEPASGLLRERVRMAGETRGFAVARLLTHWADIVGADLASATRPVKVSYAKGGMGGTLTLLTTGAMAPMIDMQKDRIREKVNACYGYNAISRVHLTQTAATGFAEGQAAFAPAPKPAARPQPAPEVLAEAARVTAPVQDDALRAALEALAQNILNRPKSGRGTT
jgi:hypothetical protein